MPPEAGKHGEGERLSKFTQSLSKITVSRWNPMILSCYGLGTSSSTNHSLQSSRAKLVIHVLLGARNIDQPGNPPPVRFLGSRLAFHYSCYLTNGTAGGAMVFADFSCMVAVKCWRIELAIPFWVSLWKWWFQKEIS